MQVPLDRLLLETDSPDGLLPLQKREISKQKTVTTDDPDENETLNKPANVRCTYFRAVKCPCIVVAATCLSQHSMRLF